VVQVDPIKPTLKPPGTKRLSLKCAELLSISAFEFNLRRYTTVVPSEPPDMRAAAFAAATAAVTATGTATVGRCRLTLLNPR
jgi:hypothetical protein